MSLIRKAVGISAIAGGLLCLSNAQAAIIFDFNYVNTGAGLNIGFNDPTQGAARQNALETSAAQWGSLFDYTATIQMNVTSSDDSSSSTLASAGSSMFDGGASGFNVDEVVKTKILTGTDTNGSAADGVVDVNWGQNWGLSANASGVGAGEFDFFSTMYHELGHAMGFGSTIAQNGDSVSAGSGYDSWATFDQFIVDSSGNAVINGTTYALDTAAWNAGSVGGVANGLFFNGANAIAANGGNAVGLYTPNPWEGGSSVSHLDDQNSALSGYMMLAATNAGPGARTLTNIEKGIFMDIGYTFASVSSVPEPSALLLMGAGGLLLLGQKRRREQKVCAAI